MGEFLVYTGESQEIRVWINIILWVCSVSGGFGFSSLRKTSSLQNPVTAMTEYDKLKRILKWNLSEIINPCEIIKKFSQNGLNTNNESLLFIILLFWGMSLKSDVIYSFFVGMNNQEEMKSQD